MQKNCLERSACFSISSVLGGSFRFFDCIARSTCPAQDKWPLYAFLKKRKISKWYSLGDSGQLNCFLVCNQSIKLRWVTGSPHHGPIELHFSPTPPFSVLLRLFFLRLLSSPDPPNYDRAHVLNEPFSKIKNKSLFFFALFLFFAQNFQISTSADDDWDQGLVCRISPRLAGMNQTSDIAKKWYRTWSVSEHLFPWQSDQKRHAFHPSEAWARK